MSKDRKDWICQHGGHVLRFSEEEAFYELMQRALHATLDTLPSDWLTREMVVDRKDDWGNTVLLGAAKGGALKDLPPSFLTAENLSLMNEFTGATPFELAARFKHLDQIPRDAWDVDILLRKDHRGRVFQIAVRSGCLDEVPIDLDLPDWAGDLFPDAWWQNYLKQKAARLKHMDKVTSSPSFETATVLVQLS